MSTINKNSILLEHFLLTVDILEKKHEVVSVTNKKQNQLLYVWFQHS